MHYADTFCRMHQDAEAGYGNAELSIIRVQPNLPGAYPYQMPVPVAAMPIYGSSGGRFRLSCNNMLSPRLKIPKEISHRDLRHEINFVKDTTSDRQTFLKLFQYFRGQRASNANVAETHQRQLQRAVCLWILLINGREEGLEFYSSFSSN